MGYYLKLAIRHMTQRKRRTILTLFGIAFSLMLCFVLFSAHRSFEQYAMRSTYETYGETQLILTKPYYVNPGGIMGNEGITKDTVDKLLEHALVKEVVLVDELNFSLKKPNEAEKNGAYSVRVALHTPKDIKSQANKLSDDIGTTIIADDTVLAGLGEETPLDMMLSEISCLAFAMVFVFFAICMIRNMMVMSIAERMRDYGLYRCVGMSAKQLYSTILAEAVIMVILSTAIGILGCLGMFRLLESWINGFVMGFGLTTEFLFVWSFKPILYMFLVGIVIVIFAIVEPCRQAMRNSPIEALNKSIVRNTGKRRKKKEHYFLGLEGMYAKKNICHKPGQFFGLLAGMFAIVFMFGTVMCFTNTIAESYEKSYQKIAAGEQDYFSIGITYDEKIEQEIEKMVEDLDSVEKVESFFEALSFETRSMVKYFPEVLITDLEEKVSQGTVSYEKMKSENGLIFCKAQEESSINYQVGDSVTLLTPQGMMYALDCLYGAYEKALHNLNMDDAQLPEQKDSFMEYPTKPEVIGEAISVLKESGYSMQAQEESDDDVSLSAIGIYREICKSLLETTYGKTYTVQAIMDDCAMDYLIVENSDILQMLEDPNIEKQSLFIWGMSIQRDEKKLTNAAMVEENILFAELLKKYPDMYFNNQNAEYIAAQITLNLVRNIVFLVSFFIMVVAVVQIFNTTYGNMLIREKELWAFSVIGMSKWQQWKMLLLESVSAAVLGALIGYITSWAGTSYLIGIVNQELSGTPYSYPYSWPTATIIAYICLIIFVLIITVFFATGKRKKGVLFSE